MYMFGIGDGVGMVTYLYVAHVITYLYAAHMELVYSCFSHPLSFAFSNEKKLLCFHGEKLYDKLMQREARLGRDLCDKMKLGGEVEVDGTCLRTLNIAPNTRSFAQLVQNWKVKNPRKRVPPKFLLFLRVLGMTQRGSSKMIVAPAALTLTAPKGKPPTESFDEIRDSGLLSRLSAGTVVYTDGCRSWNTVARQQRKKYLVVKSVVHSKSEWTRKVKVRGKNKLAGTQQIDRCWFHLKKFCPKQMKSRTGPTLNGRFWDRIYQWVFRHNSRKWQIHKLREKGQKKLFVAHAPKRSFCCFPNPIGIHEPTFKNTRLQKAVLPCF